MPVNQSTIQEFNELITHQANWCVSIFLPTFRAGAETQQGAIRTKNLIGEAKKGLKAKGMRGSDIDALFREAESFLGRGVFWQEQRDGLAIFIAPEFFRYFQLPIDFDELVMVAERFHIKPMLPLLSGNGRYYLLALSLNGFRFFEGSRDGVDEIELENVPESLEMALQYDEVERQLQHHVVPRTGGKGDSSAIFHGHGTDFSDDDKNILHFFRAIDQGIQNYLKETSSPLVLAGVDPIRALYHKASTYSGLVDKGISGNPEMLSSQDLHQSAWKLVEPHFERTQAEAVARFNDLANTNRASSHLETIVPAAYHGQIDTLFLEKGISLWGKFDTENNRIKLHKVRQDTSDDLLDLSAAHTLTNRGSVFVLEREQWDEENPVAAIFRYPLENA